MEFKWYVLNYNINAKKVEMFNIFSNWSLKEAVEKEIRKYLRAPNKYVYKDYWQDSEIKGFEGFCKEIESLIMWQEWGRVEYEISVGEPFEKDVSKLEKWDCYQQCEPNIEAIVYTVIRQYKEQIKNKK
jgi:hypothetical protein